MLAVTVAIGCKEKVAPLELAERKLLERRVNPSLGDIVGLPLEPAPDADWWVFVPSYANAASFGTTPLADIPNAVRELSGKKLPVMALVDEGRVAAQKNLPEQFYPERVLVRSGDAVNGIRFYRAFGISRHLRIVVLE